MQNTMKITHIQTSQEQEKYRIKKGKYAIQLQKPKKQINK